MSKIGNHVVEVQESDEYRDGWLAAERGEPRQDVKAASNTHRQSLARWNAGWDAFHVDAVSM